jgi:3',5'-cyclic AMP phosphodiesterase CpdA
MKIHLKRIWAWALLIELVFTLLACAKAGSANTESGVRFYFVQITDTHFGERDQLERTRRLVDQINRLPYEIACVVHTGDIFADNLRDAGVRAAGLGALRRLKAPLHFLPGNHDILQNDPEHTAAAYTRHVGSLMHQAEYHGVVFVLAYTEPLALGFTIKGYEPLRELEAALARAADKPILLFHHRPAVDDYYEFGGSPGWSATARAAFAERLAAYDVKAVVTGHFHRDELHWVDGRPVFAAPPVAGYWGRQACFRLYEYRDGRLGYRTICLPD